MRLLIVFLLSVVCVFARHVSNADNNHHHNILSRCTDGFQEFADCLKYKTIKLLDRVITNKKPIPLANFLYLTHDDFVNITNPAEDVIDEEEVLRSENVDTKLNEMLARRVRTIASTKNLQIKLDDVEDTNESRKKKDKGGHTMMMMMGAGAMMIHAAMSKIAFIAGKALIVAKIALIISAVIGLKKLLSHDDHHDSTQVIYKQAESVHGGGGWHRSIDNPDQVHAHQMAYGSQIHES